MKNQNRFKNKQMTDTEIEIYCQGVDEILTKIKDRCDSCDSKEKKKRKDEDVMISEEERMTVLQ